MCDSSSGSVNYVAIGDARALDSAALDAAEIALARQSAGRRTELAFMTASATLLPFEAAQFDIVFTNKVLHHVPEWRQAIEEIKRVTAPGGYVVFADLNVPAPLAPLLRRTIGHAVGIFTRRDLDRCFSGLHDLHRHTHWLHYEAVLRKSS